MQVEIIETATGNRIKATIDPATNSDFPVIGRFKSEWIEFITEKEYEQYFVFKLQKTDDARIMGMLCLIDELVLSNAVEIRKIEVIAECIGSKKEYNNIAGCLIAFACQYSINKGLKGNVVLIPIKKLRNHYIKKYRMEPFIEFLEINVENAKLLISEYL